MHSRIFQLSKKPISENEYMQLSDYYDHWFTNEIADSIDESDRYNDIQWLQFEYSEGIICGEDDSGYYIVVKNKENLFTTKFESFKRYVNDLQKASLDDFINSATISAKMYQLQESYNDKFAFWVVLKDEYDSILTFDEFIRYCETDTKYYIGNTIDYHY